MPDDLTVPQGLDAFFAPRSIAILGASSNANKIGGVPLALLKRAEYRGAIYPINPTSEQIQGIRSYPTLDAVGQPVDMAIVALPARIVEAAVEDCINAGVRAIVMFSAGLGEIDAAGKEIEQRIADRCRATGTRLLGPNALGLFSSATGVFATFSASFEATWPRPGGVAIASQSGAVGSYCYAMLHARGVGMSHFIATGNEADVDIAECIDWLADDPATTVIAAYVEGTRNGPALSAALRKARAAGKPVVMMKVGRSSVGAAAVASHTGSIAGASSGYDAILAETGTYSAKSVGDLVDAVEAASGGVLPMGRKVGVITPSGGIGVLMADLASDHGLELPELPADAQAQIRGLVAFAGARNPIDVTAQVVNDMPLLPRIAEIAVQAGNYDTVILFLAHMGRNTTIMDALIPPLSEVRKRNPDTLFIVCTLHEPEMRDRLKSLGFLTCSEPHHAIRIAAMLADMARPPAGTGHISADDTLTLPVGDLDEHSAKALLSATGIPFPKEHVATTPEQAAEIATKLGLPVALKILSPDIAHKSDVGGVRLGLATPDDVANAAAEILRDVPVHCPEARISGLLVSPMLTGGVECVVGSYTDPIFGPIVMLGLGGVLVEVLRDVVFRPAPVTGDTAREMIRALRAAPLLTESVRGQPPVDTEALAQVIMRISQLAAANVDRIAGIELNPYLALPTGGVALDALISRVEGP